MTNHHRMIKITPSRWTTKLYLTYLLLLMNLCISYGSAIVSQMLPERCRANRLPSDCFGDTNFVVRYFFNGTQCIEHINVLCNYDGTENNFAMLRECRDLCEQMQLSVQSGGMSSPVTVSTSIATTEATTSPTATSQDCNPADCLLELQNHDVPGCTPSFQFPRIHHYYFNREANMCVEFDFFGCAGNGNNFESIEDCQNCCLYSTGITPTKTTLTASKDYMTDHMSSTLGHVISSIDYTIHHMTDHMSSTLSQVATSSNVYTTDHLRSTSSYVTTFFHDTNAHLSPTPSLQHTTTSRTLMPTPEISPSETEHTEDSDSLSRYDYASIGIAMLLLALVVISLLLFSYLIYSHCSHVHKKRMKRQQVLSSRQKVVMKFTSPITKFSPSEAHIHNNNIHNDNSVNIRTLSTNV